jgi:hypothetical protein
MRIADSETAQTWLGQFDVDDQRFAVDLLDAMVLVSGDDLAAGLRSQILSYQSLVSECVGLYAERELPKRHGVPFRLFKEAAGHPKRASGVGPYPVMSRQAFDADVGSEGIIAQLISELCSEFPTQFENHPGPDTIRKRKVHHFVVVSDFLGSGNRVWTYLEAAWRVRSVRSWHSLKNFHFAVVAYAATAQGSNRVKGHSCKPTLQIVRPCPTIETEFAGLKARRLRELCVRYDPIDQDARASLGFEGTGALIAFAHGVPNNAPRVLHKKGRLKSRPWTPLFPATVTASLRSSFSDDLSAEQISNRLGRLRQGRLAVSPWLKRASRTDAKTLLVLAALGRRPRFNEVLARKTGLSIPEVAGIVASLHSNGWINDDRIPTDAGHDQLRHAKDWRDKVRDVPNEATELYYPQYLRASTMSSS